MKLLCLFVVLLLWQIAPLRVYTQKFPLLDYAIDQLENCLNRVRWFLSDTGLLGLALIASLALSLIDTVLGIGLVRFVYDCLILWFILSSLQKIEFPPSIPEIQLEENKNPLFAQLPASLWSISYYWVSPLFSYVLFGVFGLGFYWALCYLGQKAQGSKQNLARGAVAGIDWAPVRLLAFAYAIAGNFSKGLRVVSEYFGADTHYNQYILLRTVFVSVEDETIENGLAHCIRIQRDACILLLGIYALLAVLTWLI